MIGTKGIVWLVGVSGIFVSGYGAGSTIATNKYKAILAETEKRYEQEKHRGYEALIQGERKAKNTLVMKAKSGQQAALKLRQGEQALIREQRKISRSTSNEFSTKYKDCTSVPIEWVRAYNEALGLWRSSHRAEGSYANTASVTRNSKQAKSTRTRIQQESIEASSRRDHKFTTKEYCKERKTKAQGAESMIEAYSGAQRVFSQEIRESGATTPQDILAHIQDYGMYCRSLELQLKILKELLEQKNEESSY